MKKKVLLAAEYSILDPLGLFHLSAIARQEGWEPKIVLGKRPNYEEISLAIEGFKPDAFGFTLYTGNHVDFKKYLHKLNQNNQKPTTIVGGPHPTYFPKDFIGEADFSVIGEGFNSFRKILRGEVGKGIVHLTETEKFPLPDRESFYEENPKHNQNPIKNIIASVGCAFKCTHCYNSSNINEVEGFNDEQVREMETAVSSKRFFPYTQRDVGEIMKEVDNLKKISPATNMLFIEDDVFGINVDWLREFSEKYNARIPFHTNMRFEFVDPEKSKGRERLKLLKQAGCTGLSLAIESGSEVVRQEILNRKTSEELIFRSIKSLGEEGFKVRTYNMIGFPYGATKNETKMNLEADLETLEFNVRLKEETGLPTFAWASTLVPYPGTKIANYCSEKGFYNGTLEDIAGDETYRIGSVLKHLKNYGSKERLSQEEQKRYGNQLRELMNYFPILANIPKGHELARKFLERGDLTSTGFNKAVRSHVYRNELFGVKNE